MFHQSHVQHRINVRSYARKHCGPVNKGKGAYHSSHPEDVAVVTLGSVVFGDVREMREIVSVLARAVDVADLVFADQLLCANIR